CTAGPASRGRRAADHERCDRGARARRQVVSRPRRRGGDRGPDLSRRDHGVPQLRGRGGRRSDGRARARGRRAGAPPHRGAAAEVAAQLVSAKENTDQCAGALGQRLFEEYVRRGWIDEQLVASRSLYLRKCERTLAALERCMPAGTHWTHPEGGFFSWLTLPEG